VEFEWHEAKRETNIEKHNIDFRDIPAIWQGAIPKETRFHRGEQRTTAYGTLRDYPLIIVYTKRGERIRLISARPASRKEREDHARAVG
jgi:hypothetical protein